MKNKIYFFMALCFIALGEINAQSEDYAKYYNKANSLSESDFEKAENAYLEAIDIKPDFYDALYNLGVMYYNKGGDMLNEANNIKDFKKQNKRYFI